MEIHAVEWEGTHVEVHAVEWEGPHMHVEMHAVEWEEPHMWKCMRTTQHRVLSYIIIILDLWSDF